MYGHWQLTFSAEGRFLAFPDATVRRFAAHLVVDLLGRELVLFSAVDDHVHVVVRGARERARRAAQALLQRFRPRFPEAGFEPVHISAIEDRAHARRMVPYLIRQPVHHGLPIHPARFEGSCFLDLAGARLQPGYGIERLRRMLPRYRIDALLDAAGVRAADLAPASDERVRATALPDLRDAAAAALGVHPVLPGQGLAVVAARRSVAHLARRVGLPTRHVADVLQAAASSVRRLARQDLDPRVEEIVLRQVTLRSRVPYEQARGPRVRAG